MPHTAAVNEAALPDSILYAWPESGTIEITIELAIPKPVAQSANVTDPSLNQTSPGPPPATSAPSPLPTAVMQRLNQVFEHGKRSFDKGDWDYAHQLFSQCVSEAPGHVVFLQHLRANLTKCGTKSRSLLRGVLRSKSTHVSKLADKGQYAEAFLTGCAALRKNVADVITLREMATACGNLGYRETQLHYLRWALDADPKDHETNRQAGLALAAVEEFDQAIACWQRILQEKADDEEASKAVSRLSVEKTIHQGGYDPQLLKGDGETPQLATARVADLAKRNEDVECLEDEADACTSEETLVSAIDAAPGTAKPYVALADYYTQNGREVEAERLYAKAITLADDPLPITEKLEETQLRRLRVEVARAQLRMEKGGDAAAETYRRTLQNADQIELEVYQARAERKPNDPRRQFDFGVRLKRVGKHREAIKALQAARDGSQRTAETQLYLGECFQTIKQFKLAETSYDAAVEASAQIVAPSESAVELRKLALYRAGVLAMGLGDLDKAEQRLTELAGHDFSYRDVADRLDKIASMRKDE